MGILLAVAMALPVGLIGDSANAFSSTPYFGYCTTLSGTVTYAPALPPANTTKATPTAHGTVNMGGCADLGGPTSGTVTYTVSTSQPSDCFDWNEHDFAGSATIAWNTGQSSTISSFHGIGALGGIGEVSSGLLTGTGFVLENIIGRFLTGCLNTPGNTLTLSEAGIQAFDFPGNDSATCTAPQSCDAFVVSSATPTSPALTVEVSGTPASGTGTVSTRIASGSLPCPSVPNAVAPIADLTDTGFAPTDRLTVTATFPLTAPTSAEQVCFDSTLPFLNQSSPNVATRGPALLLPCTQTANVAPCVLSSGQVGTDFVVKFVVPGGDPRFRLVEPTGRQMWLGGVPAATIRVRYSAHLYSSGGKTPVHWSRASGSLPPGCTLNANTGVIAGTPTKKGKFKAVVQAKDSEKKPQIARMAVSILVN